MWNELRDPNARRVPIAQREVDVLPAGRSDRCGALHNDMNVRHPLKRGDRRRYRAAAQNEHDPSAHAGRCGGDLTAGLENNPRSVG